MQGWGKQKIAYTFRDGSKYNCGTKCGRCGTSYIYEPAIYNPEVGGGPAGRQGS